MDVVTIGESMIAFTPQSDGLMRHATLYSAKIAGAESNVVIGLARLGHRVSWISRVGDDEFGATILARIRGEGVDVSQVKIDQSNPTGIMFKERRNEIDTRVYYYRNNSAASHLDPKDINAQYLEQATYLHVTGITPALSDSCLQTVFAVIAIAKEKGVQVVFDPNLRRSLWSEAQARSTLLEMAASSDIVLPGIGEAEFLFGKQTLEYYAERFHAMGVPIVVIKLGENGAFYSTKTESELVPSFPVSRVVDPVGAGDGFAAGFLSGMIDGASMKEAVKRGCAIGAMVSMVSGDIEGLPTRAMLDEFLMRTNEDVKR